MKTMKKFLFVLLFAISTSIWATDVDVTVQSHQTTTPSQNARFEILQSTIAARLTFRLDRYMGRVWQLVKTKDDDNMWEEIPVVGRPQIQSPNKPRFQLFTSGLAARHTFLLDCDTGKTWVIVSGKQKEKSGAETEYLVWRPFAE
jgi:hypothetical protein